MAVPEACHLFARANRGPYNRFPFIRRICPGLFAKHRKIRLFCSALLFPKGGDIIIGAFLGMENVYDDILEIDEDPAVA